jgi:type IV pilus assembly protein PilF
MRALATAVLALLALAAGAQQRQAPTDPKVTAARANAELAVAYLKQNDVVTAREKIEKALTQNPKDASVQTSAGLVYERLQQPEDADRHYSAALRLEPHNGDMQNNYAVFQCRRGRYAEAQKLFEQAAHNPSYKTPEAALANAGVCARAAGDLAAAEEQFRRALLLRADFPDALLQLADIAYSRGKALPARAFIEHYFAVGPSSPESLLLAVRIERALNSSGEAERYAALLERLFPDSEQARKARRGAGEP